MPIPLRVSSLKLYTKWPKSIIIHHTVEENHGLTSSIDTAQFQTGKYEYGSARKTKEFVTKYHIIVEKIGSDFYPIISRPLFTQTHWDDIPDEYRNSIHIGIFGDYENDIPMTRMYNILAFKVLWPLTIMFRITEKNILLHKEISTNPNQKCPGEFFDKTLLISSYRKYRRVSSIQRNN